MGNTKEYVPSPTIKASVVNTCLKEDSGNSRGVRSDFIAIAAHLLPLTKVARNGQYI